MFFKDSANVAATSYSKILKHLEETIEIFLLKLTSLKCITPNGYILLKEAKIYYNKNWV